MLWAPNAFSAPYAPGTTHETCDDCTIRFSWDDDLGNSYLNCANVQIEEMTVNAPGAWDPDTGTNTATIDGSSVTGSCGASDGSVVPLTGAGVWKYKVKSSPQAPFPGAPVTVLADLSGFSARIGTGTCVVDEDEDGDGAQGTMLDDPAGQVTSLHDQVAARTTGDCGQSSMTVDIVILGPGEIDSID